MKTDEGFKVVTVREVFSRSPEGNRGRADLTFLHEEMPQKGREAIAARVRRRSTHKISRQVRVWA